MISTIKILPFLKGLLGLLMQLVIFFRTYRRMDLKKCCNFTTQKAYSFAGQSLTLADCLNTLIRDYNSIKNTHPRVGIIIMLCVSSFYKGRC